MDLYAGSLIRIECKTWIKGVLDDPTTMRVSITIGSPTGVEVLAPTDMINDGLGHWSYGWDSTGEIAGTYYVKLHGIETSPGSWKFGKFILL